MAFGTWAKRVAVAALVAVVAVGGYGIANWSKLQAQYADRQFRAAATTDERVAAATKLAGLGPVGRSYLLAALNADDADRAAAAVTAIREQLDSVPAGDPQFSVWCKSVIEGSDRFSPSGAAAALELVPELLRSNEPDAVAHCRLIVELGLKAETPDARVRAIRLAFRPDVSLRTAVVPLLADGSPDVRRAALLAVGPPSDDAPLADDDALFRLLHDPDADVRDLCESTLIARGATAEQVGLARKLSSPDPTERLGLVLDLSWAGDSVRDAGPWLERLSRDADPAVRIGAARVAYEARLEFVSWADRLASSDPDPTVRRLAGFYRTQAAELKPAAGP